MQVFQTFACESLPEVGKSYLRADFRIECGTPRHKAYKIYAGVMILLCELFCGGFTVTNALIGISADLERASRQRSYGAAARGKR